MSENIVTVKSPARGSEPWWMATHSEREKNCGYVVQRLKDLPKLHKAVWKDDLQRVKTVLAGLKKTMYIDYFDKEHRTALHFACARGHDGMVRVICQNGASPNIEDGAGKRPLHKAVESGNYSSVQHLLEIGANPNVTDKLGRTPLHLAAKVGNIPSVQLLLESGARTDALEKDGLTVLHVATLNSNLEIVQLISSNPNCGPARDSDITVATDSEKEECELSSPQASVESEGGVCSGSLSNKDTLTSCSSDEDSSDFELIFDTDDDCSIDSVSQYFSDEMCTSSCSSSEEESLSETSDCDQTSSESEESSMSQTSSNSEDFDSESPIEVNPVNQLQATTHQGNQEEEIISSEPKFTVAQADEPDDEGDALVDRVLNYCIALVLDDSESDGLEEKIKCRDEKAITPVDMDTAFDEENPLKGSALDNVKVSGIEGEVTISPTGPTEPRSSELSQDDELLRKQLALLESFQTLVADTVEVTKRHQLPALHERCPRFACYEPVMFKFSDLAVHFLNDSSRVPAGENLLGLAGMNIALAWVDPKEMLQADPTCTKSFKALISPSPMMRIMGLGVIQWIDTDCRHVFIVSPELTSSSRDRVNTIVLGATEYPGVFHCWPPQPHHSESQSKPSSEQENTPHQTNHICNAVLASKAPSSQSSHTHSEEHPLPHPQPLLPSLMHLTNQNPRPPPTTLPSQQHNPMNYYSTLPRPPPSHCPAPTLPHHGNYPIQPYQARTGNHLPRPPYPHNPHNPHNPPLPPSTPCPYPFNTLHRSQYPSSAPPPSLHQYQQQQQSGASHNCKTMQPNKHTQNKSPSSSLNQLLRLFQLPPRFRPQEWFTSI